MDPSLLLVAPLVAGGIAAALGTLRLHARLRRRYVRLRIGPFRTDRTTAEAVVGLFDGLHKRLLQRWWRRLLVGQPSVALQAHLLPRPEATIRGELAVSCPEHKVNAVEAALRGAYLNTQLEPFVAELARPPYVLRLTKRSEFITRLRVPDQREPEPPLMDRVLAAMQATGVPCSVQLALTPTPAWFERRLRSPLPVKVSGGVGHRPPPSLVDSIPSGWRRTTVACQQPPTGAALHARGAAERRCV